MTANSFSSVSLTPPLVLWSIDRASSRFSLFDEARDFAINVLAEDQESLARRFAIAGPDQFLDVCWSEGKTNVPILDNVSALFECRRAGEYIGGDHLIVVGRVERAVLFDRPPLLFYQGRFRTAGEHPDNLKTRSEMR